MVEETVLILVEERKRKKHPTDEQLINQLIESMRDLKTVPKSITWNSLSYVKKNGFASVNTFIRHFGSFDRAVDKAIEKIEADDLKIYYQDRR